jgi:outer membrane receptor protein involved in Fe transport
MRLIRTALGAAVVALAVSAASAQTGGLKIRVFDASDKSSLPGATVTISSTQGFIAPTSAATDKDGIAFFPVLRPAGGYVIEVNMTGYQRIRIPDVRVKAGAPVDMPVGLTPDLVEKVDVVAGRAAVNLEETSQSVRFSDEFLQDLPVQGRFYQNMLTMAPGVQDSDGDGNPNVQGARSRDFKATVNGVSNQDPLTGEWLSYVNSDSIEEVEVITAGAGAEYGRAQGGFGSILQKQGSNDFEGSFNFIYRSSKLEGGGASNLPSELIPEFDWFQPSIQVSGPIIRDKLWYRLSHEYIDREDPISTGSAVEVSHRTQSINADQITWQVSPKNKLAFQYGNDPLKVTNVGISSLLPPSAASNIETGGPTYTLTWTSPYSTKLLVDSLISYQDSEFKIRPTETGVPNDCFTNSGVPAFDLAQCNDLIFGTTSGSYWQDWQDQRQRFTARSQSTLYGGRLWGMSHQFKFGFIVENERYFRDLQRNPVGLFYPLGSDTDDNTNQLVQLSVFALNVSVPHLTTSQTTGTSWGIYGEDQLKPLPNLTATIGLRLDRESISADGFALFDPTAEFAAYNAAYPQAVLDGTVQRLVQTSFTAYEDLQSLEAEISGQLGVPIELSGVTNQGSFWQNTRRPGNINITNTNLAPRLSLSWDPWNDGKTKFALTAGRYYDKIFLAVPAVESEPIATTIFVDFSAPAGSWQLQGVDPVSPGLRFSLVDRNLKTPYKDEFTLSVERALPWPETSVKLTYVHNKFEDQLQDIDINKIPSDFGRCNLQVNPQDTPLVASPGSGAVLTDILTGQTYTDTDPGDGDGRLDDCTGMLIDPPGGTTGDFGNNLNTKLQRPDGITDLYAQNPAWGSIYLVGNYNTADYTAYILELVRRQYRGWQLEGSYTYSKGIGDAEDYNLALGDDRSTLQDEHGYLSYDQRHVVKVNATTITPWNFRLGLAMSWQSGLPYSLLQRDFSFDSIPPSTATVGAPDPQPRTWYPTHQRNDQRNPGWWNFDVSFIKEMNLPHGMNLQLRADVFNLLNDDTVYIINNVNGNNNQVQRFGREYQLGMRLAF